MNARIVCDTSTVVSALLLAGGRLDWLREAWRSGRLVPLVSSEAVAELLRVLDDPRFELTEEERYALLGEYLAFAELVDPPKARGEMPPAGDARGLRFIELAADTGCSAICSTAGAANNFC